MDEALTVRNADGTPGQTHRYQAHWKQLRLIIEPRSFGLIRPAYWQIFVYDEERFEVLHTAPRMSLDTAKLAAVEFAAKYRPSPPLNLKPEIMSEMLSWEPA